MHVYLHVPFCARRCSYCDFAIAVRRRVPSDDYVAAVLSEWSGWLAHPIWELVPRIETIYFGGGTPSRLDPAALARLLDRLAADRTIAGDAEITLEANPDDVTGSLASAWRAAGVNRISLGVQSFEPEVLGWMHRTHTAEQSVRAVEILRDAGFGDLSLDLIFGLPPMLRREWAADLERAFALAPDHLSLYGLTVESHTPLGHWTARGEVPPIDDERYAAEFLTLAGALEARGYEHYEVSNAAMPGHRSRHNSAYWRRAPYIGLGPSAHSAWGVERQWNLREWSPYHRAIEAGATPVAGHERLLPESVELEEWYLGLRTREGLPVERIPPEAHARWLERGWGMVSGGRLSLNPEGWLRLDALVSEMAAAAGVGLSKV
jgi:oxygen-independent coproporphyrinogen III oxidase